MPGAAPTSCSDQFGLADAAGGLARTYSGGMRRRLDLAASMIAAPPVMFLDEPTTGLDPVSRAQIWQAIRDLVSQSGTSVLLTSQYLEEAEQLADQVTVISDGLVAASGTPGQLRASVGQASVRIVVRDATPDAASRLAAVLGPAARTDGRVLTVPAPDGLGSLAEVVARIQPMAADVDDVALQRALAGGGVHDPDRGRAGNGRHPARAGHGRCAMTMSLDDDRAGFRAVRRDCSG